MLLEKVRVLTFAHQNSVRFMFLEFLEIVKGCNRARNQCFWCFYRHYSGDPGNIFE